MGNGYRTKTMIDAGAELGLSTRTVITKLIRLWLLCKLPPQINNVLGIRQVQCLEHNGGGPGDSLAEVECQ